ncbi:hypothetical protein R3P38DRAFT_2824690 [Favolaschia claudopus]|uniref:Uncharacterized protein n=1 Tax=Favolaschia claudopus TaxID=2862362 RepID=A0AAW0EGE3_9AGAR
MASNSIDNAKCILVIGATSGIGRALAIALSELPSHPSVIAAGRRQDRLKELEDKKLETVQLDVTADTQTLKATVDSLIAKYPNVRAQQLYDDALAFISGIQYQHYFNQSVDLNQINREIQVNYLSVVSVISMFMPHLLELSNKGLPSFIAPVTSGLAFLPAAPVINYCASKAALRSFTTSLRMQLADTKISVIEIIPPLVESELHDEQGTTAHLSKFWMPLDEYTKITVDGLRKGDSHVAAGTADNVLKMFEQADLNGAFPVPKLQ